jgi:hypothetical protein
VQDNQYRWSSIGISASGQVTALDFGVKEADIVVTFDGMSTSLKNSIKSYLMDTIKAGNTVSVVPDAGDDLGVGATGATNMSFISMSSTLEAYNAWTMTITFKHLVSA